MSAGPSAQDLAAWLPEQRWFAGKARRITGVDVEDRIPLGQAIVLVVAVRLDDGGTQRYTVPVVGGAPFADALDDSRYPRALLDLMAREDAVAGERGGIAGARTRAFPRALDAELSVRRVGGEQSNTSLAVGDRLVLKHLRRLADGRSPDEEIGRFLTERTSFPHVPRLVAHAEYRPPAGEPTTMAVVHELVTDGRDGWQWMLDALGAFYAGVDRQAVPAQGEPLGATATPTLAALRRLGAITADLHRALASDPGDAAFAPEPITAADVEGWARAVERQLDQARALARDRIRAETPDLATGLRALAGLDKIRHHGDFHLGQTLYRSGDDWILIDFEGEPLRPLAERRRKASPLRDVAGLVRSLAYAATSAMPPGLDAWAAAWEHAAAAEFVDAYRRQSAGATFAPESGPAFTSALAVFVVEKAAYEVVYEASHRPAWLPIPIRGLERALATLLP